MYQLPQPWRGFACLTVWFWFLPLSFTLDAAWYGGLGWKVATVVCMVALAVWTLPD